MSEDTSFVGEALDFIFGHVMTPEERMKEMKKTIRKSKRDLDKTITKLETDDERLIDEIREAVDAGATRKALYTKVMRHTRILHEITIIEATKDKLTACGSALTKTDTTEVLTRVFTSMTLCMKQMNNAKTLSQMTQMMMEFDRETEKLEITQEMLDDRLDEVYADQEDENEEDTNDLLDKILAEQGIKLNEDMPDAPMIQKNKAISLKGVASEDELKGIESLEDKELYEKYNRVFGK